MSIPIGDHHHHCLCPSSGAIRDFLEDLNAGEQITFSSSGILLGTAESGEFQQWRPEDKVILVSDTSAFGASTAVINACDLTAISLAPAP